jgi:hypothetical protein
MISACFRNGKPERNSRDTKLTDPLYEKMTGSRAAEETGENFRKAARQNSLKGGFFIERGFLPPAPHLQDACFA